MSRSLIWISLKLFFCRRSLFGGSTPFAFVGLVLGVAALVVSMGVFAGFENTLKNAVIDVTGHVQVVKRSRMADDWKELASRIKLAEPELQAASRFIFLEAIVPHQGKISGVLIQGVDFDSSSETLNFKSRIISGDSELQGHSEVPQALIGKGLASKLGLKVGDQFRVVVPVTSSYDDSEFKRKLGVFEVRGILDLGKFEWNERFVVTDLKAAQVVADIGDRYSGLILKFQDPDRARESAFRLSQVLGAPYWIRDWRESNENLFEAAVMEKFIIFFVVLIIVVVASFNISATLSVNVMQRYSDIAILKTIGISEKGIRKIFALHGLMIGVLAVLLGFLVGAGLGVLFGFVESHYGLLSGSVYKIEGIKARIQFLDLVFIGSATLVITFIATLVPARKGAKLSPVEGLRHG